MQIANIFQEPIKHGSPSNVCVDYIRQNSTEYSTEFQCSDIFLNTVNLFFPILFLLCLLCGGINFIIHKMSIGCNLRNMLV